MKKELLNLLAKFEENCCVYTNIIYKLPR
ncbi:hypothetical protein BDFB_003291 [Asbolus verrucosus]|uniref:Uncharacterized protein n=1 Tax=Asbolus verrucosus TaxID=1661398 RepID=A0A482W8T1_ASBVE|nr:hypothetical protein BDFB_003291 [Asbolus verrucosus]